MKTRLIILLILFSVLTVGCRKHKCKQMSWTDYNAVEDVWCNFKYNKEESKAHLGDTIKVYGLLYHVKTLNTEWSYLLLTCCKDLQYTHNGGDLFRKPYVYFFSAAFNDSMFPTNPYESPLYVTGTLEYDEVIPRFFLYTTDIKKD